MSAKMRSPTSPIVEACSMGIIGRPKSEAYGSLLMPPAGRLPITCESVNNCGSLS